jgi:FG-GAP repeat.
MNSLRRAFCASVLFLTVSALAAAEPPAVPPEWTQRIAADISCGEYHFAAQTDNSFSAPNRAQGLRSSFTNRGLHVESRTLGDAAWSFDLSLARFGRERALSPVSLAIPVVDKNRISYTRTTITDWYVNDSKGLEQGFDVTESPRARNFGRLAIEMAFSSPLKVTLETDGRSIQFQDADGQVVLRYGELEVTDAAGSELQAALELGRETLRILVNDESAVYPIRVDPLFTSPAWTASGDQGGAQLGVVVASAGNVDGDSYADVLVGAPFYDSGQPDEGKVFLYLGSASGPVVANWTGEGDQNGAQFGFSVASAGDVNGDGRGDVIIGAPFYDNVQTDEGRAYIYHGGSAAPYLTLNRTLERDQAFAEFGTSVASAGRINSNDIYSDVIVGAPRFDNGQQDEGRVWVWKGSATGIPNDPHWRAEINQVNAFFGYSVASAGDIDGDGDDEVLIGAPQYDSPESNEGAVFLWEGGGSGLGNDGTPNNVDWSAQSNQSGSNFGLSLASAGNVNGDAYDDIIVGAELYSNPENREGAAFVWLGSGTGLGANGTPTNADWRAESNQPQGALGSPNFGHSVASAGDVNNDGFDDVLIGAYFYSGNGTTNNGAAFLWEGSASGLGANGTPANAKQRLDGEQHVAWFGFSVAGAGDVDNDGYDDVLVGAPLQDTSFLDGGRAYLYRGTIPCHVLCQTTWCKFQDFKCTADINCVGQCCNYINCVDEACNAQPCPPNACPGTCP